MDVWNERQMRILELGGNESADVFFEIFKLKELPIKERYVTNAAAYYREKVRY